jgi:hypothetical protein
LFGFPILSAACWLIGAEFQPMIAGTAAAVAAILTLYVVYVLMRK